MKVNYATENLRYATRHGASSGQGTVFAQTLSAALSNSAGTDLGQGRAADTKASRYAQAAADLAEYLAKSPAQHIRDAVLKEMGLTEEELAALPPEQRQAVEDDVNRRVRERLLGKQDGPDQGTQPPAAGLGAAAPVEVGLTAAAAQPTQPQPA